MQRLLINSKLFNTRFLPNVFSSRQPRVLVAMSGGVDSSVSAALLKRSGFDVAAVFMRCWQEHGKGCQAAEDENIARLAAAKLKIPFYVFDFQEEYKKKVFNYFIKEYKAGRTPNPDVMCNKEIKFGLLFDKAMELGFDFLATGHYARIRKNPSPKSGSSYSLAIARDKNKDQSYFLCEILKERLPKVIFPIGNYKKSEVRKMAKSFGLPNAEKKDSQGICFVGKIKLRDFLKDYIKASPGDILDIGGKVIGRHQGLSFYTIGQRKGIRIAGGPFYVVAKNVSRNTLIVSKDWREMAKKEIFAKNVNWFLKEKPKMPLKIKARIRYRQELAEAVVFETKKQEYKVVFAQVQRAAAPGQKVVFYKNQEVLGGGTIV